MRKLSKKSKAIVAIAAVIGLASSGAAYAYWTSTGSGSGSASTATPPASSLDVASSTAPTGMAPGVAASPITVTVRNTGTSNVMAQQVIASISSVVKAVGAPSGACVATDYTLSGATMTVGAADLAPAGTTIFTGATLGFNNTAANQDGCKGATVNLAFALS